MTSPTDKLIDILQTSEIEIRLRILKLFQIISNEWRILGKLKKEMNKLIDKCRICEKKVKVTDIIDHSYFCEIFDKMKDQKDIVTSKIQNYFDKLKNSLQNHIQLNNHNSSFSSLYFI